MSEKYDKNNAFAKILSGDAPCVKVYEDELTLAFMDFMPQIDGHVLVIPKEEAVTIYDLSNEAALACMQTVQKVGKAVEQAMEIEGSTIFQHNGRTAGQTVAHFHFHVLPGSLTGLRGHAVELAEKRQLIAIAERIIQEL
ncbi:HIT family protein [Endozoicomonas sp. OPT23]|uniref:HIT family protein n=1 Tax=Endozoicomonas sp. OPT23 TaxID=2072845 RepID=UPI00129AEB46|nr:HIT domain-containing protein [Endozoicomonas sp. OPT23]MRI32497.1 HIT family protein [Endozoicomonas sp. OPT23]